MNLLKKGVKTIFYPSIPYDIKEEENAENHYNCPIVTSYPEVIEIILVRLEMRILLLFIHSCLYIIRIRWL